MLEVSLVNDFLEINIDGTSCKVAIRHRGGSKDLLFFLHGIGCSKENFAPAWNFPGLQHASLLSIDFPGFGFSEKPSDFSYKMEDQASVCNKILYHFPDYDLHIVAHSMGGAIGLLLSDNTMERVKSFSNLEGNLIAEDCFISRKVISRSFEIFKKKFFPKLRSNLTDMPELLLDLEKSSLTAYYKSCESLVYWSDDGVLLEKFKSLKCEKSYFYGERNKGIEPLRQLENIRTVEIENSGHMMMLDNPAGFYSKLKNVIFPLKN